MKRENVKNGKEKKLVDRVSFDSFDELLSFCKERSGKNHSDSFTYSETNGGKDFYGTKTFEEALSLGVNGWNEGTALMTKGLDKVTSIGKQYTFSPIFSVAGESVEVGRFLSGEPECMQEWELIEANGNKIVDVYYNLSASAAYSTNALTNYGIAILSIVDHLESIGVRCNIFITNTRSVDGNPKDTIVKVKSCNEPLNFPIISYCLAHPSYFRRLIFKVIESFDNYCCHGYGSPLQLPKSYYSTEECILFQSINNTGFYFNNFDDVKVFIDKKIPEVLNDLQITEGEKFETIH